MTQINSFAQISDSPLATWEVNFGYPNVWMIELDGTISTGCTPFFLMVKTMVSGEDFPNQSSDGPKNQHLGNFIYPWLEHHIMSTLD